MPFVIKTVARDYVIEFTYTIATKENPLFSHGRDKNGIVLPLPAKMITKCVITDFDKIIYANGLAYCSIDDEISFQQGRKHSFTRALKAMDTHKLARSYWWEVFFNLFGKY